MITCDVQARARVYIRDPSALVELRKLFHLVYVVEVTVQVAILVLESIYTETSLAINRAYCHSSVASAVSYSCIDHVRVDCTNLSLENLTY